MNWKKFCDELLAKIDKQLSQGAEGEDEEYPYDMCLKELQTVIKAQREHAYPPTPPSSSPTDDQAGKK